MILHLTQFFSFLIKFGILPHDLIISANQGFESFPSRSRVLSFQYIYIYICFVASRGKADYLSIYI